MSTRRAPRRRSSSPPDECDRELEALLRQREERERETRELEERIRRRTEQQARVRSRSRSPRPRHPAPNPTGGIGGHSSLPRGGSPEELQPEEEQEITEDLDADAEGQAVDQEFYRKLFATLRSTKTDKWSIRDKSTPAGQLSKLGRLIPRVHGPFLDMGAVVTVGMAWYGGVPVRWQIPEDTLSPEQRKRLAKERSYVQVFAWLQERLPFLEEVVPLMVGRAHDTFTLGAFLDTHARQARATDLNSLKKSLADYVEPATITPSLAVIAPPNNNQRKNKDWYGWYSAWTARLLVPRVNRDEFDDEPQLFSDSVISGDIIIDHHDYPSYMYIDDGECEFDRDNVDLGLCRGDLLLKGYRHVLTSPSSVNKPPGKKSCGRGCISQIYKLEHVTPETLAYIAVLIRSVLSSASSWDPVDGPFKSQDFFDDLVSLFKSPAADDEWVRDTLIWWNSAVYGKSINTPGVTNARRPASARQSDVLARQRAARLAARSATAMAPSGVPATSGSTTPTAESSSAAAGPSTTATPPASTEPEAAPPP